MFKKLVPYLILFVVLFLAYGLTLKMYFWQDDSALIFKLQNPEGPAGSFGSGIIGNGPYKYLVTPFVPFFPLFGIKPFGYFLVGFLSYVAATYVFYLFVKKLFGQVRFAYVATLIFAAGYVGSEIMFRVINSWQTNIGLILTFLLFERLADFVKTRKFSSYTLSVIYYALCSEFVFIRSHSLIFPIVAFDFLFSVFPFKITKLRGFLLRQIPFLFIFKYKFLSDNNFGGPGLKSLFQEIIVQGQVEKTAALLANTGNIFFSHVLQNVILNTVTRNILALHIGVGIVACVICLILKNKFKLTTTKFVGMVLFSLLGIGFNLLLISRNPFWYRDIQSNFAGLLGIELLLLSTVLAIVSYKKYREIGMTILFGLVFAVSQMFGYFVQYPTAIFNTTHRYFSYSLIGYALFFAALYKFLFMRGHKRIASALIIFVVVPNLILGIRYQSKLLRDRSVPSENFYKNLTTYVPKVEKGSAFYFDVSNQGISSQQLTDFFSVGSMPDSTALAMYYGIDRYDVVLLTSFDELLAKLASGELSLDKTYTFYYSQETGLLDTTEKMRQRLATQKNLEVIDEKNLAIESVSPSILEINLTATPTYSDQLSDTNFTSTADQISYLVARQNYYSSVRATSSSEWKYREVRHLVDSDMDTPWQGHRIYWSTNKKEEVVLDLGQVKSVDRVIWRNWITSLAPVDYEIATSKNGTFWWPSFNATNRGELANGQWIEDRFDPTEARFVKFTVTKTMTDDSPAILEMEVVETKFKNVNVLSSLALLDNLKPIGGNLAETQQLFNLASPLARVNLTWESDERDPYLAKTSFKVIPDGQPHIYSIVLTSGGTRINKLNFSSNLPLELKVNSLRVRNLTLPELIERKLVKQFTEN